MYSRKDTYWIYLYYSGISLKDIGNYIGRCPHAVLSRIKLMKLPTRPRGSFTANVKERWLKEPHVIALRKLFDPGNFK